ncbi:hypothetical protein [Achromobacter phage CF418P1]|nr:hypothetical protein [Achromobacter phage CF418P1]
MDSPEHRIGTTPQPPHGLGRFRFAARYGPRAKNWGQK